MLTAGEYVMSRDAVQKYGVDTLRKLNEGKVLGFANGGLVEGAASPLNKNMGDSAMTNNVNITVNVDNGGDVNAQISSNAETERSAGQGRESANELARTIENAVVKVLVDQQKQGGMLNKLR